MTTKSQNIDDLLTPTTLNDFLISDPVSQQTLFDILNGTILNRPGAVHPVPGYGA